MGRRSRVPLSDSSDDSSGGGGYSDYGVYHSSGHRSHIKRPAESAPCPSVSSKLRPRTNRRNLVYQELDSDIDQFLDGEEDNEPVTDEGDVSLEDVPVVLENTVEKFLMRRVKRLETLKLPKPTGSEGSLEADAGTAPASLLEQNGGSIKSEELPGEFPKNASSTADECDTSALKVANTSETRRFAKGESFGKSATLHRPLRCCVTDATPQSAKPSSSSATHEQQSDGPVEYEYLVKYHQLSYLHCEWLSEKTIFASTSTDRPLRTRFNNFLRKLEAGAEIPEVDLVNAVPERIVDCSDPFRALYPTKAADVARNDWTMYCLKIVDALVCFSRDHRRYGIPFLRPVDEEKDGAPGYYTVVKDPMDFVTVQTKLYLRRYETPQEFWADVKRIFSNCLQYNSPRTEIAICCRLLEALFDKLYHEWACISREKKEDLASQASGAEDLPYVPTSTAGLTLTQAVQHVSFQKQLQSSERTILYLVKWKNRSYTEMSWEFTKDIADKMKIAQYHRHVRVPEYVVSTKGPGFWELDLQRKMLQETFLHCKAAREYLYGNISVPVQSLPMLSSAGMPHVAKERWSYNSGHVRDQASRHQLYPRLFPFAPGPGGPSRAPMTAAAAANAAADSEQQKHHAMMMRRNALMVGSLGNSGSNRPRMGQDVLPVGGYGPNTVGAAATLVPSTFLDQPQHSSPQQHQLYAHPNQQYMSSDNFFANPANFAAFAARFGRYVPHNGMTAARSGAPLGAGMPAFVGAMPSQLNMMCQPQQHQASPAAVGGTASTSLGATGEINSSVSGVASCGSNAVPQFSAAHLFPSLLAHHQQQQQFQQHGAVAHQSGMPSTNVPGGMPHFQPPNTSMMHNLPHTVTPHQHLIPQVAFPTLALNYRQFMSPQMSQTSAQQQQHSQVPQRPPISSQQLTAASLGMAEPMVKGIISSPTPQGNNLALTNTASPVNGGVACLSAQPPQAQGAPHLAAEPAASPLLAEAVGTAVVSPVGNPTASDACEGYVKERQSVSSKGTGNADCCESQPQDVFRCVSWAPYLVDRDTLCQQLPLSLRETVLPLSSFVDTANTFLKVHVACEQPNSMASYCEGYVERVATTANTVSSTSHAAASPAAHCLPSLVTDPCPDTTEGTEALRSEALLKNNVDDATGGASIVSRSLDPSYQNVFPVTPSPTSVVGNEENDTETSSVVLQQSLDVQADKSVPLSVTNVEDGVSRITSLRLGESSRKEEIAGSEEEQLVPSPRYSTPAEPSESEPNSVTAVEAEVKNAINRGAVIANDATNPELSSSSLANTKLNSDASEARTGDVAVPVPEQSVDAEVPAASTPKDETAQATPPPPVVIDRSRPASFAAQSIYAEQYSRMKMAKPPPPGVSRHYPVSSTYKGNRKLFDYQLEGLNWMLDLWSKGNNGILADEMGLGKTVQSMAFLWHLYTKERMRGPFLVVAPLSTLDHWKRTAEDWTDLNVVLYYDENGRTGRDVLRRAEWYHYMVDMGQPNARFGGGGVTPNGQMDQTQINPRIVVTSHYKFQLLLTSYEIFASDAEILVPIPWQFVVVDEAHRLKNRLSKTLQLLRQVACRHTLLLTGTPVQNNTEELWPLLNYIEPVRFCDVDAFKLEFGDLQTNEQVTKLTELLRPHLLRRVKEDVADSIPPLEETIVDVELTILQKAYYKAIFERNKNFLFKNARKGQQVPSLMNVEMELRKCCNHPFMIYGVEQREYATCKTEAEKFKKLTESSGKLVLLDKLLPKLEAEGHKVLIFSQFQQTLSLIQEFVMYKGWGFERLDGQVKGTERSAAITRFNDPNSNRFVFLLSTRAGGLGINLTSADTVIIFDSDWNPQNDIQATARAHRIGQEREVKVYRLVTARTYEADMFDRASKKLGLNTAVFHRGAFDSKSRSDKSGTKLEDGSQSAVASSKAPSKEEIEELLKKGAFYLLENNADAAREFQENNIEEILSRNSRLVRYQLTGMRSTFAKTSFKSDKASDLSFDDPDFWQKVLNDSSSRRLLARLNDGSATASEAAMEEFMSDLQAAVEGIAAEDDPEPVIEALVQLSNLTTFSAAQREQAEEWLARVNTNLEALHEVTDGVTLGVRGSPRTPSENGTDGALGAAGGSIGASTAAAGLGDDDEGSTRTASGVSGSSATSGLRRSARVSRMEGSGSGSGYGMSDERLYWMMTVERDRRRAVRRARRSGNEAVTTAEGEAAEVDERDGAPLMPRKKRTFATDSSPSGDTMAQHQRLFPSAGHRLGEDATATAAVLDALLSDASSPFDDEEDDEDDEDTRQRLPRRRPSAPRRGGGTGTRARRRSAAPRNPRAGTGEGAGASASARRSSKKMAAASGTLDQLGSTESDLLLNSGDKTRGPEDAQAPVTYDDEARGGFGNLATSSLVLTTPARKRRVVDHAALATETTFFSSPYDNKASECVAFNAKSNNIPGVSNKRRVRTESRRGRKSLKDRLAHQVAMTALSEVPSAESPSDFNIPTVNSEHAVLEELTVERSAETHPASTVSVAETVDVNLSFPAATTPADPLQIGIARQAPPSLM